MCAFVLSLGHCLVGEAELIIIFLILIYSHYKKMKAINLLARFELELGSNNSRDQTRAWPDHLLFQNLYRKPAHFQQTSGRRTSRRRGEETYQMPIAADTWAEFRTSGDDSARPARWRAGSSAYSSRWQVSRARASATATALRWCRDE
jgi:hypothetical protein